MNKGRGNASQRLGWQFVVQCIIWGSFLVLAAELTAQTNQPPVRIGEINPLTGKLAMHGMEIHQGILYAIEEANAGGGLHGRPVGLISRDDQSQPEVAINQAQELLLRERVVGLVGGYVDAMVAPISEVAARHRIPYVASASLQRALTREQRNPFFFRVARLEGIVDPLCQFVIRSLEAKRVAILYAATPGSSEFAETTRTCLEKAGTTIPIFEKFRPGSPDFSAFLLKVQLQHVDALISGGFYPDHLILLRQLREQRIPLRAFLAPWGVAYQSFIEEMGNASELIFGVCAWNPGITLPGTEVQSQSFTEGFRNRFHKQPNTTTMHGYTSARALLYAIDRAMEKNAELNGVAISRELARLDLQLPMERLEFDDNGDPRHYEQVVVQIQQGALVVVYPPGRATGKAIYPMK